MTMADDKANDPDEQLVQLLRGVHDKLQRPETINLALHNYAMTEIANTIVAQGLERSGQIDLPISAISRVIDDAPEHDDPPVTTTCTSTRLRCWATRSCNGVLACPRALWGRRRTRKPPLRRMGSSSCCARLCRTPGSPRTVSRQRADLLPMQQRSPTPASESIEGRIWRLSDVGDGLRKMGEPWTRKPRRPQEVLVRSYKDGIRTGPPRFVALQSEPAQDLDPFERQGDRPPLDTAGRRSADRG